MFNWSELSVTLALGNVQKCHSRVLRGGSWNNNALHLRSPHRNHNHPHIRNHNICLRLAGALTILCCFCNKAEVLINQHVVLIRKIYFCGQIQGSQRVSRQQAQSLLLSRLLFIPLTSLSLHKGVSNDT